MRAPLNYGGDLRDRPPPATRPALVIQHDHVNPPGPLSGMLRDRGYDPDVLPVVSPGQFSNPGTAVTFPDPGGYALVVLLGSEYGVCDPRIQGWVRAELRMLADAQRLAVPVLGICFGAQLLTLLLRGQVTRAAEPRIGWRPVRSYDQVLLPSGVRLQWHADETTWPEGVQPVAENPDGPQAWARQALLALAYHPFTDEELVQLWLDHTDSSDLARAGTSRRQVLDDTRFWGPHDAADSARLLDVWLPRAALARAWARTA